MKSFVFLYPIPEYIDFEIENNAWKYEKKGKDYFKNRYGALLNKCIDVRYRQKGFNINYAIFNGHKISDIIILKEHDKIFEVGMDFKTHTTESNGKNPYPDNDLILDQLGNIKALRVAGFHIWDCVNKLARRAYERGLDTLVDEDLTELFSLIIEYPGFRVEKYPSYNPRKSGDNTLFEEFMQERKDRPWLWQKY
ncbi:hypothetical protein JW851_01170 [Candidatus Woesearchaeota archaeon]|nr:hypothetical protein [Candidatus Woesearchaeota archaeon]